MKTVLKIFLLAFLTVSCTKTYPQIEISGDIQSEDISEVKIFAQTLGSSPIEATLSQDEKSYSITLPSEESYITTIMAIYTLQDGRKMQIYSPIYISPEKGSMKIDVTDEAETLNFKTQDRDNDLIFNYTQELYSKLLRTQPSLEDNSLINYTKRFTEYADSLSAIADNEEIKGYLSLRGFFDRRAAISMINFRLRGTDQKIPEAINEGMPTAETIVNNPAAKFFPQEIAALVKQEIATGNSLTERIAKLKTNVADTALVATIENQFINSFVSSYNFEKGVDYAFSVLDSVAANHPKYDEWKSRLQLRSASMPGAPTPDIEILDADGNPHKLSEFKGKYIYVDFWASWCGPCNREIPFMKDLEKTLNNDMVTFVGISIDEDANAWKEAMKRHGLTENQYLGNSKLSDMLSIQSIPRYVLYDKEGKLIDINAPRPSSGDEIRSILKNLK